ncbi:protein translocase subunit SecF [Rhodovulum sp. DZ06]|uniref:protein translocase subunit SecF n=1 Tax=Rhodovulum sp. DZ06 TaxID=3425126 RepID=UPI003D344D6F
MRLKLVPDGTKIDFMRVSRIGVIASITAVIASIALFFAMGLNFGIDFRGGTMIEARTPQAADLGIIRQATGELGLGDVAVQEFGDPRDVLIRVETQPGDGDDQMAVVGLVQEAVSAAIPDTEFRRVEVVGPKVSGELVVEGALAIGLAVFAVLVYIWLRFEWQFSLGAVIALVHDVALTIGVFSLVQLEFNLSIIAALLTIVGYSLNDTVVVFDRVRENLRRYKQMPLIDLLNLSINETLSRTLMTSLTTLIALIALYVFGGEVIRGFTFAMIWGIVVGTYSSVFIAAATLLRLGVKRDWSTEDKPGAGPSGTNFSGAQV